jgi:acetyl-CoA carboxylase biotin carboxyl carrier protein
MDLDQLKQILDLVRLHDLTEFEIEHEGLRLRIRKDSRTATTAVATPESSAASSVASASTRPPSVASTPSAATIDQPSEEIELAVVKSPIVGTFYRSPEPDTPPFVEIGSVVKNGQVLCIIEAMKLMNEIDSEYEGEIVNIYVENGQPVQYGERLFAIKT